MRRWFASALATALGGSLLAVVPAVVAPATVPAAEAQTQVPSSYPEPWLHRTEIVEGQSREFLVANVPSGHSGYWL
ncbi:MAG: hypothetical protein OXF65_05245, partial [Acidimicrobiaceae bacterium]|nr:hypothetical protein [Acidimicrobiaceae bacterium]